MLAYEVVVADVQFLEAFLQGFDHHGVAVAEVENAAVTVAIDQPFAADRVPHVRTLAPAENEFHIVGFEGLGLAR